MKLRTCWQTLIIQTIGVIAETILLSTIPIENALLRGSILRFISFDGAGVVILLGALLLVKGQDFHPSE